MHGAPALAPDFAALPYVNPEARRGGTLRLGWLGGFDSLNPYNVKSLTTAEGLEGHVFESLMARSRDEPFTLYGLIAKTIETDAGRETATFRLDPRARFSDGSAITADDVRFSFELLRDHGRPPQRAAYARVAKVETPDPLTIRFDLHGADDRELPLILGLMPVLSRAHTDVARFDEATLAPPLGSGPYRVAQAEPGRRVVYVRNPDYWARDLPISRGRFNFDRIEIDYYRDEAAMFSAFAAGLYDVRFEDDALRWARSYDFPRARRGEVLRQAFPVGLPRGMTGFVFNTRRPVFADVRVREALAGMFDFEWLNAALFGGAFARTVSFFDESPLASTDPRGRPPVSDGSGRDRVLTRKALDRLAEAGWTLRDGALGDAAGRRLAFEILTKTRADERLALEYARMLARIGVAARVRLIDESEFQRRRQRFDFDMMPASFPASASPGAEQRGRWSSAAADMESSYNLAGVRSAAVDAAIAALLAARDEATFIEACRALDGLLLSGFYVVPFFHAPKQWVAWDARLGRPERTPLFGVDLDTWWRR